MTFAIDWHPIAELEPPLNLSILIKTDKDATFAAMYDGNGCFKVFPAKDEVAYFYSKNTDILAQRLFDNKKITLGQSGKAIEEWGKVTHWNIPC